MHWLKPAVNSIRSILGQADRAPSQAQAADREDVRDHMLDLMFRSGAEQRHGELVIKISFASSIETLWYARCEVMAALSEVLGEARAQQQLAAVSEMFRGLLPEAAAYRPTRRPQ